MHIVNSCANDIQHTENNKQCQNANYHLNRFLSASAFKRNRYFWEVIEVSAPDTDLELTVVDKCPSAK